MRAKMYLLAMVLAGASILSAHDIEYRVEIVGPTVIVRASYAGEAAVSYSPVLVYGPEDRGTEYQNGRTDAKGVFSFVPDQGGEWLFVLDDDLGHRVEVPIEVPDEIDPREPASGAEGLTSGQPTWQKLITGVSLIMGLTGILFWYKASRLPGRGRNG